MQRDTELTFYERANGRATDRRIYSMTAGAYIDMIKNTDSDGRLTIAKAGEDEYEDAFYDLPLADQLDRCMSLEADRYAMSVRYEMPSRGMYMHPTSGDVQSWEDWESESTHWPDDYIGTREVTQASQDYPVATTFDGVVWRDEDDDKATHGEGYYATPAAQLASLIQVEQDADGEWVKL